MKKEIVKKMDDMSAKAKVVDLSRFHIDNAKIENVNITHNHHYHIDSKDKELVDDIEFQKEYKGTQDVTETSPQSQWMTPEALEKAKEEGLSPISPFLGDAVMPDPNAPKMEGPGAIIDEIVENKADLNVDHFKMDTDEIQEFQREDEKLAREYKTTNVTPATDNDGKTVADHYDDNVQSATAKRMANKWLGGDEEAEKVKRSFMWRGSVIMWAIIALLIFSFVWANFDKFEGDAVEALIKAQGDATNLNERYKERTGLK